MVWTASTYERRLLAAPNEPSARKARRALGRVLGHGAGAGWRLRVARAAAVGNAIVLIALAAATWPWLSASLPAGSIPGSALGVGLIASLLVSCVAAGLLATAPAFSMSPPSAATSTGESVSADSRPSSEDVRSGARLDDLVDRMRHDLRTPLNAVIGFSDIMQQELLGPLGTDRYQGYAGHIRESGLAVLKAAEDTLALTRLLAELASRSEKVELDVDPLVRRCIADIEGDARSRDVVIVYEGCRATTLGDQPVLEQAITSLLSAGLARARSNSILQLRSGLHGGRICLTMAAELPPITPSGNGGHGDVMSHSPFEIATGLISLQGGSLEMVDGQGRVSVVRVSLLPAANR
jgi:signal transduction histidine kinase